MALDSPTQTEDYLPTTAQESAPRPPIPSAPVLYMAIELASKQWKIAFSDGGTKEIVRELKHERSIAKLREQLTVVIAQMKRRFALADDVAVISCMEAGRDGFWPHRLVQEMGLRNVVVDPASVRVNRRSRRAKTDRLDAVMMLADLVRYHGGDTQVWSAIRAPSPDQEDARRLRRWCSSTMSISPLPRALSRSTRRSPYAHRKSAVRTSGCERRSLSMSANDDRRGSCCAHDSSASGRDWGWVCSRLEAGVDPANVRLELERRAAPRRGRDAARYASRTVTTAAARLSGG